MDSPVSGKVLLVGEGDFSFSVAMVQKLPSSMCANVIATSIETHDSIKKHIRAKENMKWLKAQGIDVRLEIDATQLHVNLSISQLKFSRILFNFPHVGGKSNHRKNRKLLNDFFASAAQVLEPKGQIMMTLCKGQGGTPRDQPLRAWHDSWQVVSMAANSGLILVAVLPFYVQDYCTYSSTGFRSVDKGFHTDNALTHVFEMAEKVVVPNTTGDQYLCLTGHMYSCSQYLYKKLLSVREINKNEHHPIHRIYRLIKSNMLTCFPTTVIDNGLWQPLRIRTKEEYIHENLTQTSDSSDASLLPRWSYENQNYLLNQFQDQFAKNSECEAYLFDELLTTSDDDIDHKSYSLVGNLMEYFQTYQSKDCENIQMVYGPMFLKCKILQDQAVASYHMILSVPFHIDHFTSSGKMSSESELESALKLYIEKLRNIFDIVIEDPAVNLSWEIFKDYNFTSVLNCNSSQCHFVGDIRYETKPAALTLCDGVSEKLDRTIGEIFVTKSSQTGIYLLLVSVNLCDLACFRYHIANKRILWSRDSRVVDQFEKLDIINTDTNSVQDDNSDNLVYKLNCVMSPSLYQTIFTHDMSFWLPAVGDFDELIFCDIIRNIAGDNVVSVTLIDKYNNPAGKSSCCFRLVFQSVDKALSYDTSWKLQSKIRLEVQNQMKVILR